MTVYEIYPITFMNGLRMPTVQQNMKHRCNATVKRFKFDLDLEGQHTLIRLWFERLIIQNRYVNQIAMSVVKS